MSLLVGARARLRVGAAPLRPSLGELRGFQTCSSPTASTRPDDGRNRAAVAAPISGGRWNPTRAPVASPFLLRSRSVAGKAESPYPQPPANPERIHLQSRPGAPEDDDAGDDDDNFRGGKPTLAYAKKMSKTFASMTNEQVLQFAEYGIPEACRECVVRDVMVVDRVEYDEAMKVFEEIAKTNREGMQRDAAPFYIGLGASVGGAYASIPLVFQLDAVKWFNEKLVTTDLPPPEDLETWLEVGSWSWGWMEPVLGQLSFFLLCMQFARAQMQNLGLRPYFHWQQENRARRLIEKYPQYDAEFLANYSRCDRLSRPRKMSK